MTAHFLRTGAAALMLLAVAGCSSQELAEINPLADDGPKLSCPQVQVLADAASLTRFQGQGHDLTDVQFEADVADVAMGCEHDIDEETGEGTLEVSLEMFLEARRGPADTRRKAPLTYFVSLTDAEREVLDKGTFTTVAEFPGNHTRVQIADEPVTLTIPLAEGQTGRDFRIYVGFQLTRDELQYNRRKKEATRR